jgi:hypothetical protein
MKMMVSRVILVWHLLTATYLLLNLETLDDRSQLVQDLVSFFVILNLSSDKLCEVAKGFGGVQNLER